MEIKNFFRQRCFVTWFLILITFQVLLFELVENLLFMKLGLISVLEKILMGVYLITTELIMGIFHIPSPKTTNNFPFVIALLPVMAIYSSLFSLIICQLKKRF
jgi:hypothetical protein